MTDQTALVPAPNMWDIWKGKTQTYLTYDGRECTYNMQMLDAILGKDYATAPIPEKAAFIAYCVNKQLDPIRKQVYFIKYSKDEPAGFVTNWEVFVDRAQRHPQFDGYASGIVWLVRDADAKEVSVQRGKPCDYIQDADHRIVGGWATAYRKDRSHPSEVEVPLEEMIGKKRDGTPSKFWRTMLTTMGTKTPTARALRHAFPDTLGGLYTEDETAAFAATTALQLQSGEVVPVGDLDAIADQVAEEDTIEATVEPVGIDKLPPAPGESTDPHQTAGDATEKDVAAGPNGTAQRDDRGACSDRAETIDASTFGTLRHSLGLCRKVESLDQKWNDIQADPAFDGLPSGLQANLQGIYEARRNQLEGKLPLKG